MSILTHETRHLFIVNPAAGSSGSSEAWLPDILAQCERRGLAPRLVTLQPGDRVADVIRDATDDSAWRVYLCGGDGTMNQALPAVAGRPNLAVTTLPGGTGNDFLRSFGEQSKSFQDLSALLDGEVQTFDLISAGEHLALNIASVGFDARVADRVHRYKHLGRKHPRRAYDLSVLVNMVKGLHRFYRVTLDGEAMSGRYSMLLACNGQYYGGGYRPAPQARLDDGWLDFVLVRDVSRVFLIRHLSQYARGELDKLGDAVLARRGHRLTISADDDMPINLDGEIVREKEITFALSPHKLRYIVPASAGDRLRCAPRLTQETGVG